ncbi:hypothetical protein GCM10010112_66320 [Actinoplanes lobatus]|uniref:Uncharacterized protein n=1 Tax=Actinoplanes lobatus TaxID=113568 RepID=A0A7W7MIS8_9ACTN|nr:hypothetical protein [Actinoplanes lobatus]MBB4751892.1 hypothetical protein [Actinoplanes lobatus]GGN85656.1 hypothetical protein GCM10010112_66320 [Actinoplanes lobatus]GIE44381.1 hypothetical protein Alo02nite_72790 [Actinoplanes lobatus]
MSIERVGAILRAAFPDVASDDPVAYFKNEGDVFQALSFSWLFWPRLVELYGAVFIALHGNDEVEISERLSKPLADGHSNWPRMVWSDAVDSYNWFELDQLFTRWRGPREFVAEAESELAEILVHTWRARLVSGFPDRRFAVTLSPADESVGLAIRVRQESPQLEVPQGWDERRRFIS